MSLPSTPPTAPPVRLTWPNRPITLADWDAMPEDSVDKIEIMEGILVMSARPLMRDQKAAARLDAALDEQLPAELTTIIDSQVVLFAEPTTLRIPDVVVVSSSLLEDNVARCTAADVLLAVEIISPGSRRVDRLVKLVEYAEAGIAQYWVLDVDEPVSLLTHLLVDGRYEVTGEHTGTVSLQVADHPVTLNLAALPRVRQS